MNLCLTIAHNPISVELDANQCRVDCILETTKIYSICKYIFLTRRQGHLK